MAELLHCELLNVAGRQYRVLAGPQGSYPGLQSHQQDVATDEEEEGVWLDGELDDGTAGGGSTQVEDELQASVPITQEGGLYVARLRLDAELFPFLIGHKGATRRRVEQDTGAEVAFPSRTAQAAPGASSPVVIKAPNRGAVARACTQLDLLVSQALAARGPRALDYDFVLCLPLVSPETSARFEAFRNAVLAEPGSAAAGLEASVFMHPQHLHLTVAMLKLYSDERRALARQTLRSLQPQVAELLHGAPLQIQLRGLEYMNDDPSAMHVMYLQVQDAPGSPGSLQRVQKLCAAVVGAFGQAGLLLPQDERSVKLHATVINTRYRRRSKDTDGGIRAQQQEQARPSGSQQQRQPIDGRLLLQKYAGVDLGTVTLLAVHLSQRGKHDSGTGFYHCADSLLLSA